MPRSIRRLFFCMAPILVLLGAPASGESYGPVSTERLSEHVRVLSSDAFEGRAPGTRGEELTIDYLVRSFEALGLEPGGVAGGLTQPLELARVTHDGPVQVSLRTGAGTEPVAHGQHLVVNSAAPDGSVAIRQAPLVFAGYGIHAPELGWNDFEDIDVAGAVVIVLRGEPDGEPFGGPELSRHGSGAAKLAELARRGAAGILFLSAGEENWGVRANSLSAPQYTLADERVAPPVTGALNRDWAERLFSGSGQDLAARVRAASTSGFRAVRLDGMELDIAFRIRRELVRTSNVLGRLPGAERPGETLIYLAHWDHLGRGTPDASGDDIYNGALDNASGVAGLLELARAFARGPRPERSIVFLATTAEELGLWGVREYVENPVYPLETTVAALNMDLLSMIGPTRRVHIIGYGKTSIDTQQVPAAVERQGRVLEPIEGYGGSLYNRSDHIVFAREGAVPVLYPSWGTEVVDPRPDPDDAFMETRYHTPNDEWTPDIDFRGAAQTVELLYLIGLDLANSATWPEWTSEPRLRELRQQSSSRRR